MDIVKLLKDSRAIPLIATPLIIVTHIVAANLRDNVMLVQFFSYWFAFSLVAMLPAVVAKIPNSKKLNLDLVFVAAVALSECLIARSHIL